MIQKLRIETVWARYCDAWNRSQSSVGPVKVIRRLPLNHIVLFLQRPQQNNCVLPYVLLLFPWLSKMGKWRTQRNPNQLFPARLADSSCRHPEADVPKVGTVPEAQSLAGLQVTKWNQVFWPAASRRAKQLPVWRSWKRPGQCPVLIAPTSLPQLLRSHR